MLIALATALSVNICFLLWCPDKQVFELLIGIATAVILGMPLLWAFVTKKYGRAFITAGLAAPLSVLRVTGTNMNKIVWILVLLVCALIILRMWRNDNDIGLYDLL